MGTRVASLLRQSRQCSQSGELETAENKCKQILALEPDNPAAHFELGSIALKQGRHDKAIDRISRAIELDSSQWAFHNGLGNVHRRLGNLPAATRCFRRAITLNPTCFDAYKNLGEVLIQQHDLAGAANALDKALSIRPDAPEIQHNLALTLHHLGKNLEASRIFRRLAAIQPDFPEVRYNLGVVLAKLGHFDQAIDSYRKDIESRPDSAITYNNLGALLMTVGDLDGAISCYRSALLHQPDHAQAHSNLLMTLNYLPQISARSLYVESLQFDVQHARELLAGQPIFPNSREPGRILKIGYVSSDFRDHSVAHFVRKIISAHRRDRVEIFCYASVITTDDMTSEIRKQADHWSSIVGIPDEDVAEQIKRDQIDILVDLGGHTADNRLLVFARRPAPIQVTWLGYPNTTGMRVMDYRLTDSVADPPGEADQLHTEKLVRLKHGFLCYQTDRPRPTVGVPPYLEQGHITYASFNNFPKITRDVIRLWSRILKRTPDSRLLLKSRAMFDEKTRLRCTQEFAEHGISPDRLDLLTLIPNHEEHLATYTRIDIGLDTFPYNGTTTTCEALWMGVPVICLRGDRHAGRVGASIMHHVGLPELVADSQDEYADLAQKLATDADRLATLRSNLREQLRRSVLTDAPLMAETLENAYRDMWLNWCDGESASNQ